MRTQSKSTLATVALWLTALLIVLLDRMTTGATGAIQQESAVETDDSDTKCAPGAFCDKFPHEKYIDEGMAKAIAAVIGATNETVSKNISVAFF